MNLFESLASLNGAQVKVEQVKDNCSIEVHGTIKVSVGIIEAELDYYARTYGIPHISNTVGLDDWEITATRATIGGNKIDNFSKFKNGFSEHGLNSIGDLLDFNKSEIIAESLKSHRVIKMMYGEDVIVWDLLSKDEKRDMYKAVKDSGVELADYILRNYELNNEVEDEQQ
jgi:hypothetical protein